VAEPLCAGVRCAIELTRGAFIDFDRKRSRR
jgi:hypothetical protein